MSQTRDYQTLCDEYEVSGYANMTDDEITLLAGTRYLIQVNHQSTEEAIAAQRKEHAQLVAEALVAMKQSESELNSLIDEALNEVQ